MIIPKIQQPLGMTDDTTTTVIEQVVLRLRKKLQKVENSP